MGDPVYDLKVWKASVAEQDGPGLATMLAPDAVERHAVIDLSRLEAAFAGRGATIPLVRLQDLHLTARCLRSLFAAAAIAKGSYIIAAITTEKAAGFLDEVKEAGAKVQRFEDLILQPLSD